MTPTETNDTPTAQEAAEHTHDHAHDHDHDHAHDHGHDHSHAPALNPALQREVAVEVPAAEVDKAFKKTVQQYKKLARIPGFRAGKVPESLIRTKFARELRQEVLEGLVSERFRATMEEQKLQPVSQPQVVDLNLIEGQPLTFKAIFEVLPEIDITGYDSVKTTRPDATITDDEFESELAGTLDRFATVEPVEEDRAIADGDWAEIEFKGEVKDLAQTVGEEPSHSSQPITGEDVLIEVGGKNTLTAFNDALRGAKVGQELKFEADYPADFGEHRLAGKTVAYDVTVKAIKRKTFPDRDAEFAKQLGNYESWDDFTAKLRENLATRKRNALEGQAREKMLDDIVARYDFPVPESFVQQQIDTRLDRGLRALYAQGMSPEAMRQLDFAKLRGAQRDQAVNEVKASLLLDKIAAAENVEVSQDELDRELLMLSLQTRQPLEQMQEEMQRDGGIDRLRAQVLREKTGRVLFDKLAS